MSLATRTLSAADGAVLLPHISPLMDRRKERPEIYEPVADTLERGGFAVGWDQGSIQVSSPSGSSTPVYDLGQRSPGYRPRSSGFLSFNRSKDGCPRPRSGPSSPTGYAPRTPIERFSRLSTSIDPNFAGLQATSASPSAAPSSPSLHPTHGNAPAPAPAPAHGSEPSSHSAFRPVPSSMAAPSSPGRWASPSRAGSRAVAALGHSSSPHPHIRTSQVAAHLKLNIPSQNLKDSERIGMSALASSAASGDSPRTVTTGTGHVVHVPLGVPSATSPMAQAAAFKASRGHALMVFHQLDSDRNGKVTQTELEAAAVSLGFSLEQAHRLWEKLDKRGRGFLEATDWGAWDACQQIQLFSTRYMQKYLGVPDIGTTPEQARKYWRSQELMQVRTLPGAINRVRVNMMSRGSNRTDSTGNPVYDAFRFMDTDGSGELSRDEMRDAFYALGVFVSDDVVDQIMKTFDKDGSGNVQYHEFASTMFPGARS